MRLKAESWKQYNDAALAEMVVNILPELAKNIAEPLSKVEKIIMVGDDAGVPKITGQVAQVVAQLPTVVEALTGLKLSDLIKKKP
jgi:flotillin